MVINFWLLVKNVEILIVWLFGILLNSQKLT